MSSIAYVTDESMLEYHRLCRNRAILFWRLSNRRKFTDFHKGDLLFFFARPRNGRKKGLIGYAHFDSIVRLSLNKMWSEYGQFTGYDSQNLLREAIEKASKGSIPKQMSCLYLTDVVFFLSPIYPEEVGLSIPSNLESYCYLDRSDPSVTVRILKKAEERGIDLWSASNATSPEIIFSNDEIRHQLAVIHKNLGKEDGSEKERTKIHRFAKMQCEIPGWEMIRGSRTDCLKIERDNIVIGIPYTSQANDRDLRMREAAGRMLIYRLYAQRAGIEKEIRFELIGNNIPDEVRDLAEQFNNEQI
jgi:hypothetical protein